jgi:adenylosuccinate synthase
LTSGAYRNQSSYAGTVIHFGDLFDELAPLNAADVEWQGRLHLSDRATVLFDFHKEVDGVLEGRRAARSASGKGIGTTKRGIGPGYASKATRNSIRVGHFKHRESLHERLRTLIEDTQFMYGVSIDTQAELDKADEYATKIQPMIIDGVAYINQAYSEGKKIIAEGANAAMLDIDYGTFPYVTSSTTTAGGIATGMGLSPNKLESVVGVLKAYTTRVGEGPFPTELTDERGGGDQPLNAAGTDIGLHLQQIGAEVGVT